MLVSQENRRNRAVLQVEYDRGVPVGSGIDVALVRRDGDQMVKPEFQLYHAVGDVQNLLDVRPDLRDLYGLPLYEGRLVTIVLQFPVKVRIFLK